MTTTLPPGDDGAHDDGDVDGPGPGIPSVQSSPLLSSFTAFLTVALHSLLYYRRLYAPSTFLTARAFNVAVHQSRHPGVCAWIRDAVAATAAQLRAGAVHSVVLVVHAPKSFDVLERWVFDVSAFPGRGVWAGDDDDDDADDDAAGVDAGVKSTATARRQAAVDLAEAGVDADADGINWADVDEELRGALSRLSYAADRLDALPLGCTFTVAAELRDEADPPVEHPQPWIPSRPRRPSSNAAATSNAATTTPLRSVQAGPLFFECWVEQSRRPAKASDSIKTPTVSFAV